MAVLQIYVKSCSTFDSTEQGNIGPVCDSLLEWLGADYTLLCPSLPANRRTVKDGILYVDGVLLENSPLRYHPVNPMTKSRIKDLMEMQSKYECFEIGRTLALPMEKQTDSENPEKRKPYYLIPDYENDCDGEAIAKAFGDAQLLTGGSGLCEALAKYYLENSGRNTNLKENWEPSTEKEKYLLLAGSCSKATKGQISAYREAGMDLLHMNPDELLEKKELLDEIKEKISRMEHALLIYSADLEPKGETNSRYTQEEKSEVLDNAFSELALFAKEQGIKRLIIAGGETSGAVTKALGYNAFYIGDSIAPGVPVMRPKEAPFVQLALKSGNFGDDAFFIKAIQEMQ